MITINLSNKQAANLKFILTSASCDSIEELLTLKEVCSQINNQQFDIDDFDSLRKYESLSVKNAGCGLLGSWDKATKK